LTMELLRFAFLAILCFQTTAQDRTVIFNNTCAQDIYISMSGNPTPGGGGFRLNAHTTKTITASGTTCCARMWAQTGCQFDSNNNVTSCKTGWRDGQATLFEFTWGSNDFYDISLVDAWNVGIKVTTTSTDKSGYHCNDIPCSDFTVADCPAELTIKNSDGSFRSCVSSCGAINNQTQLNLYPILGQNKAGINKCCNESPDTPCDVNNGWPVSSNGLNYYQVFKKYCPSSYVWPYDDKSSTFTCTERPNYTMTITNCAN